VFSNFTYYDDDDAQSYPQRAAISNPFSVTMSGKNIRFLGAALDISIGKTHNRSLISCQDSTESAEGEMIEVETSIWAHREDRNLLIFEVRALNLTKGSCGGTGQVTVSFESCGIGAAGTSEAFILEEKESPVDGVVVWQLTVRAMEVPPAGTKIPPPTQTQVGLAYQTVPKTLVLSAHVPASRYRAVFHSSLEFEEGEMNHSSSASKPISSYSVQHLQSLLNNNKDGSASSEVGSWAKSDAEHAAAWDEVWAGGIEVEGNATIAAAVNASLFAIVASLRADWPYGVSPGGLTHNAYCGHSFW
jgi:trehalose/maltose hydrolase-like predicted phosphorylase